MNAGNADLLKPGIADFLLIPAPLTPPASPKLGVMIQAVDNGVAVMDVEAGSPADTAGIDSGDIITRIDGLPIKAVADVRIALFDRQPGAQLAVEILRESFFLGEQQVTVDVIIP